MAAGAIHPPVAPTTEADPQRTDSTKGEIPPFGINGRFLTQPVTGVQRYAREIVGRIEKILETNGSLARIHLPAGDVAVPAFNALQTVKSRQFGGHLWEQVSLPMAERGCLLNLCNLGPVVKRRQIVCIHDANVYNMPESYSRSFRMLYHWLLPLIARRAAAITTVSHFSAQELTRHLPLRLDDITVLPNGYEHVLQWDAGRSVLFAKHKFERPYIFVLGSRARHKNTRMIFDLAGELDGLGIDIVVTGGQAGIFSREGEQARAPNLRFMGFVSDDDLAALLKSALCLVFPSFTEGFGLPILEAMALGCPVISSDRASMPEICADAALMAAPDDPAAWLARIGQLLSSTDLQSDLAARGRERVKAYSWEKSAHGYLELIVEQSR